MDLISIYSSLQCMPKDVVEIVWSFMRPDTQRKMSMTCRRFREMFSSDKFLSIPDLNSLLAKGITKKSVQHTKFEYDKKIKSWMKWIEESKEMENHLIRWRWIRKLTSAEIIFMKIEVGYLISRIRVQYKIGKYKDYSFSEFNIHPNDKSSAYGFNNIHGLKFKSMPKESLIYQQLSNIIKIWIRDERIRHLLNPVCEHMLWGRKQDLTFTAKEKNGFSIYCNKCVKDKNDLKIKIDV